MRALNAWFIMVSSCFLKKRRTVSFRASVHHAFLETEYLSWPESFLLGFIRLNLERESLGDSQFIKTHLVMHVFLGLKLEV